MEMVVALIAVIGSLLVLMLRQNNSNYEGRVKLNGESIEKIEERVTSIEENYLDRFDKVNVKIDDGFKESNDRISEIEVRLSAIQATLEANNYLTKKIIDTLGGRN